MVTAVASDQKGTIWVGTLNAGVARFDPGVNRWTRYRLAVNSITAAVIDSSGYAWVGTDGGGAYRFDGANWKRADVPGSGQVKKLVNTSDEGLTITTPDGRFRLGGKVWAKVETPSVLEQSARILSIQAEQIADFASDGRGHIYIASPLGLSVFTVRPAEPLKPTHPLPVVLVHGWTVSANDDIQDSEFRFLEQYAAEDGISVYFAQGISPKNTLFENAARLRDDIAAVKQETGTDKVNLIAFSMGGLNARAYLESSLYQNDVNRAIILGTPEAGVDIWNPILAQQIVQKPDEPSAIELSPEYARLFNQTHAPPIRVPYDLLIGDARKQPQLEFIADLPANDGLIGVASALSISGANVRHAVDDDLHAYDPTAIPFHLTSYLYPRGTYDRYLRNALRDPTNAPIGSEVEPSPPIPPREEGAGSEGNHTPVVTAPLAAGETVTRTVTLDVNTHARFLAYFPGGDLNLSLKAPDGQIYNSAGGTILQQATGTAQGGAIGLKADIASFVGYSIKDALPGRWLLILARKDKGSEPLDVTTYVDLDAPRHLNAGVNRDSIDLGDTVSITATMSTRVPDVAMGARIAAPGANPGDPFFFTELSLVDNGSGIYTTSFTPTRGGYYLVFLNANGLGFTREREFLFAVNPGGAKLGSTPNLRIERDGSGKITGLTFDIEVEAQRSGQFAIGATLHTADGGTVVRVLTPVTLSVGSNQVPLVFDRSELDAPSPLFP